MKNILAISLSLASLAGAQLLNVNGSNFPDETAKTTFRSNSGVTGLLANKQASSANLDTWAALTGGVATASSGLKTATTTVVVSGATAPSSGQVLTATSSTAANFQTPAATTTIVGITGTKAQFNTAVTDNDFAFLTGGNTITGSQILAGEIFFRATGGGTDGVTVPQDTFENARTIRWPSLGGYFAMASNSSGAISTGDISGLGTLATQNGTFSGTSSGNNSGDQNSIVGITGIKSQFNTALTDGDFAYLAGGNSFTGTQSFTGNMFFQSTSGGTDGVTITQDIIESARTLAWPSGSGTIARAASIAGNVAPGDMTGLGTGVATALGVNTGSAGAFQLNNGSGSGLTGTAPSLTAGNVTTNANLTGAITSTGNATSLGSFTSANMRTAVTDESGTGVAIFDGGAFNGTIGATTPNTGAFTTLGASGNITFASEVKSTTAIATPSTFVATQADVYAHASRGAVIQGFGSSNDVSLVNRSGAVALGVVLGTQNVLINGNINVALASTFTGGIIGTTTNNNTSAGNIGEYVSSLVASGSAVSLTTATTANVTSISLTAGDWDVTGSINYAGTVATVSGKTSGTSSTSATMPTDGSEVQSGVQMTLLSATDGSTVARKRFSLASTTTVYLVANCTFTAGSVSAYGNLTARRAR